MVLSRTSTGRVILVPTQLRFDRWFLPLAVPLGLGPKNSELWVGAGSLHVKMGWAFAADIPLTSITKAEATNARVYAAGVHFGFGRWLVNGSRKGLVALTIDPPEQAKMWKKSMTVRELWVSVTDPDALVTACTAKELAFHEAGGSHVFATRRAGDGQTAHRRPSRAPGRSWRQGRRSQVPDQALPARPPGRNRRRYQDRLTPRQDHP